ncbi:hypothetical protein [Streptococcus thermophilus]|uniref:hypothetical protein n=1 Tax=Streptococcus thermophilus TaxID=1308 RepID=UPI002626B06E|nr:hypothetical protein [Streptococcus thermophilus]
MNWVEANDDNFWEKHAELIRIMSESIHKIYHGSDKLHFFYDESNNIRVFRNKNGKFNNPGALNFVLAGIVSVKPIKIEEISEIKNHLKLDKSTKEIKFKKSLAKKSNNFLDVISTQNLENFLQYIIDYPELYLHISVLNPFYYGIVDLVDELVSDIDSKFFEELKKNDLRGYLSLLKNVLYDILLSKYEECSNLFWKYDFPAIKDTEVVNFIDELVSLINSISTKEKEKKKVKEEIVILLLRKKKRIIKGSSEFIYHTNLEKDNILVKGFSELYQHKLFLFNNSKHLFDEEDTIKDDWNQNGFLESSFSEIFNFEVSHNDIRLQISDVFAGLFANLFDFLSIHTLEQLETIFNGLNRESKSYRVLCLTKRLIMKTELFESYLLHYVIPYEDIRKFRYFYEYF